MSKMMKRSNCKPPLARSPIRLRSRRVLQPSAICTQQTPPGSLTKSQKPKRGMDSEESDLRPEYRTISCELKDLAKMVQQEFGNNNADDVSFASAFDSNRSPLFERGRFYEEYTARRNERLQRKKRETGEEKKKPVYDLGVRVESVKRRGEAKKFQSSKMVPSTPMTGRREAAASSSSRYLLRSITSKENKKPPLATPSTGIEQRKTAAKRVRRI